MVCKEIAEAYQFSSHYSHLMLATVRCYHYVYEARPNVLCIHTKLIIVLFAAGARTVKMFFFLVDDDITLKMRLDLTTSRKQSN